MSRIARGICILKVGDTRENARTEIRRRANSYPEIEEEPRKRGEGGGKRKPAAYAIAGR